MLLLRHRQSNDRDKLGQCQQMREIIEKDNEKGGVLKWSY